MADLVVLPFLYDEGLDSLGTLVVSHGDQDHAVGIETFVGRCRLNACWSVNRW
jgi:beta-lactamase superfamily II metal-dependent hydrolase